MSLIIQPAIPGAAQTRQGALPVTPVVAARGATGAAAAGANTVAFSPAAVLLAQLQSGAAGAAPLPAPGSAQATAMTMLLAQRMGVLLRDAGLPAGPALAFEVGSDGRVGVASSRPDAAQLQALVDAHPDVPALVRLLEAINAAPVAALAAATLAAPGRREAGSAIGDAAAPPAPPLVNPWGWWGATPQRRAMRAGLRAWVLWLAAAVLAVVGWVLSRG